VLGEAYASMSGSDDGRQRPIDDLPFGDTAAVSALARCSACLLVQCASAVPPRFGNQVSLRTRRNALCFCCYGVYRSESLPGCGPSMPHFPCSFPCSELGGWGRTWAATHMSRDAHGSGACSLCHYDAGDCACYVTLCLRAHLRARRPYEKSGRGYKSVVTCARIGLLQ
jgi:hypothetical protein